MVQATDCDAHAADTARFQELAETQAETGHQFFLLSPSLQDDRSRLAAWARENQIKTPILDDETQLVGESLRARKSGEVIVLDPQTWSVTYRGGVASAKAAGDAVGSNQQVARAQYTSCPIEFPQAADTQHALISYSENIAPILKAKCAICHTEGGLGPWAMSNYKMVLEV